MKMLDTVRLSTNQKRVIAKIIAAPTPKVAAEEISDGANMVKARDILMDLGLISLSLNDHAELTDNGRQVAQDENLADQSGNLTPDGEKYAKTNTVGKEDGDMTPADVEATPPEGMDMGMGADPAVPPMDDPLMMSYTTKGSLLAEMLRRVNLNVSR